ncbi:cell division protein ZipA [Acinetobacter sp. TGL-Y2]|uniref:cell division protein ZipA C-terminal FtsZ-binding domain-containing protein n=1 Tax=Acinetobacter sp. TGL-Y2 TaxID=1407071 RepID=UPI0007A67772|nr:cell division protein ZipA C-terminal FtsZ-binding domain-containing protein [Acinetobacter sp. TGL-Y2]AMW79641.1 cell division protein ZipA [Acinetobacter sp. TGL-Y2]
METTTIIGIVVAVIMCLVGLKMMLRKPNDAAPSLDSELHINQDTQKPVIPRHVRHQLQAEEKSIEPNASKRVEPSLNTAELHRSDAELNAVTAQPEPTAVLQNADQDQADIASNQTENISIAASDHDSVDAISADTSAPLGEKSVDSEADSNANNPVNIQLNNQANHKPSTDSKDQPKTEPEFVLNSNITPAEIQDFDEESSILDVHLHEQQRFDDESTLANAETIIALNVYPNPRKALSGDKTLKVLLKYGLRFGEMNCFHRYEDPENTSPLMFSVLRITDQGPAGFDLEALSVEQVQGLAFFLALPHPNVQKGYDSMVSIAGLIARETDGTVYDENNLEFTPQLKEHWRHKAIDYRPGQAI